MTADGAEGMGRGTERAKSEAGFVLKRRKGLEERKRDTQSHSSSWETGNTIRNSERDCRLSTKRGSSLSPIRVPLICFPSVHARLLFPNPTLLIVSGPKEGRQKEGSESQCNRGQDFARESEISRGTHALCTFLPRVSSFRQMMRSFSLVNRRAALSCCATRSLAYAYEEPESSASSGREGER